MDHLVIYYSNGRYVCGMGGDVLFVKGDGESRTCGCFLHVIMGIKPARDAIVIPQSAHAKEVGVEVGMVDYIVWCYIVACCFGQQMVGWPCLRHGLVGFYCRLP